MIRSTIRSTTRPASSLAELDVQRVPWEELGPEFIAAWGWPGGKFEPEHLTVYGKNGSGKTLFIGHVLHERAAARGSDIIVVATKRADKTLVNYGWKITDTYPFGYGENQVIFWARAKGISAEHRVPQRAKVKMLMDKLWRPDANVVIYWDELTYLERDLRLGTELATYYREGRSHGITNVASMQRPAGVSRLAHSEAGWTVAFHLKDHDDRRRIAEIFGDRARFQLVLDQLNPEKHEFLIRHERSGRAYISHLPKPRRPRMVKEPVSAPIGYGVSSRQKGDR